MKPLFRSFSIIAFSSLTSRLLGIYRDHLLADRFGGIQSHGINDLDVYYAAFRIPDLLYNLVVLGAVSAVFIPLFAQELQHKDEKARWEFVNIVFNLTFSSLFVISLFLFIIMPYLMPLFVPGFSTDKINLTINLSRILLLSPLFFGISSLAQSIENVFQRFFFYALAPILYNFAIIAGIILLSKNLGVYGIAFGVIAGALIHMLVQVPIVFHLGFRYQWLFDVKRSQVKKMAKLLIPRLFGGAILPLSLMIDTFVASFLTTGSLTLLNYAYNLQSLPMGVIGLSFAIVSFGLLSKLAAADDLIEFNHTIKNAISEIVKFLLPASIGLYLLRFEVTALILQSGKFTDLDTYLTAQTLGIFCFGILFQSLLPLLTRSYYALHNTRIPVIVGFSGLFLLFFLDFIFAFYFRLGIFGIALGNVFSASFQVIALLFLLQARLGKLHTFFVFKEYLIFIISSVFMGLIVLLIREAINFSANFTRFLFQVIIMIVIGVCIYFASLTVLKRMIATKI